jgi:DNA-binding transcriptional ArsR family regulator
MVNYSTIGLDRTFGALADPTRRAMIQRLARGECSVTGLAQPFDMSLPAISKHVRILEHAGILVRRKTGRTVRCRLQPRPLEEATRWVEQHRMFWEKQLDSLAAFLAETQDQGEKHVPANAKPKPRVAGSSHFRRPPAKSI